LKNQKRILAIVPARGGSKGLPHKHTLTLAGKPLLAWTIAVAKESRYIDTLILSSEDAEIISLAKSLGCSAPFVRPAALALDTSSTMDVIVHALENQPAHDIVLLLQPTSPLRTADDIDGAIDLMFAEKAPACVSVTPASESPHWMYRLLEKQKLEPFLKGEPPERRQLLPELYLLNGAIYLAETPYFLREKTFLTAETVAWKMPRERSVDIDSADDLKTAAHLLSQKGL